MEKYLRDKNLKNIPRSKTLERHHSGIITAWQRKSSPVVSSPAAISQFFMVSEVKLPHGKSLKSERQQHSIQTNLMQRFDLSQGAIEATSRDEDDRIHERKPAPQGEATQL